MNDRILEQQLFQTNSSALIDNKWKIRGYKLTIPFHFDDKLPII